MALKIIPKLYGPHFQKMRLLVIAEQPYCGTCKETKYLECHHRHYDNVECEKREDLIMLCKRCHDAITNVHRTLRYAGKPIEVIKNLPKPPAIKPAVQVDSLALLKSANNAVKQYRP